MILFCILGNETLRERNNVLLTLPKCRQRNMHCIYAIVQVLAETSLPHQLLQVHIGGANQADVHRNSLGAANPHNASILNHPQQFGLQMQWNIAYFI